MQINIDDILNQPITKVTKCYLKKQNKCNKIKMPSGAVIYEYDCLEIMATGLELLHKIKQIRGLDI